MNTTIKVVGWVGERDEHDYQSSWVDGGEMNKIIKEVGWVGERDEYNYQRSWVGGGERWTQLSK